MEEGIIQLNSLFRFQEEEGSVDEERKTGRVRGHLIKTGTLRQWKNSKQQVIQYEEYTMTTAELLQAVGKGWLPADCLRRGLQKHEGVPG